MKVEVRWQSRKAEFRYPAGRAPRTAVLVGWFREKGCVRVFRRGWCEAAARFAPQAIAATAPQMHDLMQRGTIAPDRAIILLARPGTEPTSAELREQLWRAFRVPVFEQLIGDQGELLAAECEAHAGMHIESESFVPGDSALDSSPCPCGRTTPRLVAAESLRAVAAYAR